MDSRLVRWQLAGSHRHACNDRLLSSGNMYTAYSDGGSVRTLLLETAPQAPLTTTFNCIPSPKNLVDWSENQSPGVQARIGDCGAVW